MTLADYLAEAGLKPTEFARRLNRPTSTISRLLNGERGASLDLALDIERETEGKVTAEELRRAKPDDESESDRQDEASPAPEAIS